MDFVLVSISLLRYASHLSAILPWYKAIRYYTLLCFGTSNRITTVVRIFRRNSRWRKNRTKVLLFFFLSCNGHPSCCRNCFMAACFFFILILVDSKRFEDADQKMRGKLMKIRRNNISIGPHHKCVLYTIIIIFFYIQRNSWTVCMCNVYTSMLLLLH